MQIVSGQDALDASDLENAFLKPRFVLQAEWGWLLCSLFHCTWFIALVFHLPGAKPALHWHSCFGMFFCPVFSSKRIMF